MKNYELTMLLKIDSEEQTAKLLGQIKENLEKNQVSIKHDTLPTRIKLGYPIKKNNEAFMVSYVFECEEENLDPIKTYLDFQDNILRYSLIKEKILQNKQVRSRRDINAQKPLDVSEIPQDQEENKETPVQEVVQEKKHEKKADLEEIDKKLDEMLNQ
ncbi:MAG TPA: 30S ribosomal protein S6 [Candidatus Pacearchaeota archaeon]|nr:30S ribosomal protein S6 [Candidatus Pacearchaeota archaeon]